LKIFGSHLVNNHYEISFAFHTFGNDKMLFSDSDGYNITELTLFKNISLQVRGMNKTQ